jgi:sugar phosphate isomerase/epimerase
MPLGVFTSVGEGLGASLNAVTELGVPTAQVHAPASELRTAEYAARVKEQFEEAGVDITLVFCGYPGESYASIQAVRETVGLVPPGTRDDRVEETREIADFAAEVGAPGIGMHVGFIPENWEVPDFAEIVAVMKGVCEYCRELDLGVNLETGQESPETLLHFLEEVNWPNLGVNFDPANMILYGSAEPLPALRQVGRYVRSCHCKDATWSDAPGKEFGVETPLGEGEVGIRDFISTLYELGYRGPLTIEREISGQQQITDIRRAIELLRKLKKDLLAD